MALKRYVVPYVYVNGALMAEEVGMSAARSSGAQEQNTVVQGFAGFSPGSGKIKLKFDFAVPAVGFEQDAGPAIASLEPVEVWLEGPGKVLKCKGMFTDDNFSHTVDSPTKYECEGTFTFGQWE